MNFSLPIAAVAGAMALTGVAFADAVAPDAVSFEDGAVAAVEGHREQHRPDAQARGDRDRCR